MKPRWRGLIVAGVMITTAAVLTFLTPDYIRKDLAMRILGVHMGLFVVVYANEAPKTFRQSSPDAATRARRRNCGDSPRRNNSVTATSRFCPPASKDGSQRGCRPRRDRDAEGNPLHSA
jgi:hypothetical protein